MSIVEMIPPPNLYAAAPAKPPLNKLFIAILPWFEYLNENRSPKA
jgi:hypothetical protein